MSVSAQLARGSKLQIVPPRLGTVRDISGVAPGFPTIVTTSVAHGFANGDYVMFGGFISAMGDVLTARMWTIKNVTANTFCVEADTTGTTYVDTGNEMVVCPTIIDVKGIKSIKPGGAQSSKIDIADLDSATREYKAGVVDNGTFALDIQILESDPGQSACLASFCDSYARTFMLVTGTRTRSFIGAITKWPTVPDASVDGVLTGSAEIQIIGAVGVS